MDLSSSLSVTKEFRIVKRGYDPDEVDAFLDQIALGVAELKRKLAEAGDRAAAPAAPAAAAPKTDAEEIHRALILAQRAADDEVRKATEEGEQLLAEARERAADLLAEADREVAQRREDGRAALVAEIAELEARRDGLAGDVTVLERHVDEQREVVQAAVGELQSLLDHPEAFRVAPAAEVAVAPAAVAPAPARAAVPAADEPDEDDDEEGDAAPVASRDDVAPELDRLPDIDLTPPLGEDDDEVEGPLPGLDDLTRALRAEEEDDDVVDLDAFAPPAVDPGPPTEALDPVRVDDDADEDAFLAELRKAMLDDEPLGPRDEALLPGPRFDEPPGRGGNGRARFGRRR